MHANLFVILMNAKKINCWSQEAIIMGSCWSVINRAKETTSKSNVNLKVICAVYCQKQYRDVQASTSKIMAGPSASYDGFDDTDENTR